MGYCLLYESMLYTVLHARDRYLKLGGWMVPNKASIMVCAADGSSHISATLDPWQKPLYGLDLSEVGPKEHEWLMLPEVDVVPTDLLRSYPVKVCTLDLISLTVRQLATLREPFELKLVSAVKTEAPQSEPSQNTDGVPPEVPPEATSCATSLVFFFRLRI